MNKENRIKIIDSFRAVAVMSVVCYHFYYRFSPPASAVNHLPYQYEPNAFTMYGYYGVNLFFIISGFVISLTLENSTSFGFFIKRRLIRLLPCLLLCSFVTFMLEEWAYYDFTFLDTGTYLEFLPTLSFLPPSFWNFLLGRHDITYVDGAYWTLSVEMAFYCVAGLIYFLRPRLFLSNWVRIVTALSLIRIISSPKIRFIFPDFLGQGLERIYQIYIDIQLSYWVYFALGVFFYHLFSKKEPVRREVPILMSLLVLSEFYFLKDGVLRIFFFGLILLFLIFIYREKWLFFLRTNFILWTGMISYPLYLLHEDVGLLLMNKAADLLKIPALNKYMPLFAIAVLLIVTYVIYRFYEVPVIAFLKKKMKPENGQ